MWKPTIATAVTIIIALSVGAVGGFMVGENTQENKPKTVSSIVVRETIEPYTGVGSGVYKHGTIVKMNDDNQPEVIGHFDDETGATYPGTWVIHKLVTEK
jgi:hypothetical protein